MNTSFVKRALPLLFLAFGSIAHAQYADSHGYFQEHGFSLSAGATSPFDHQLTSSPSSGIFTIPTPTGGVINTTVSNEQQFTTDSVGFIASLQFHPKPWAGVEFNYGFNHFSERYGFNYTAATTAQTLGISTDMHEATGAYQFHPKHIPFPTLRQCRRRRSRFQPPHQRILSMARRRTVRSRLRPANSQSAHRLPNGRPFAFSTALLTSVTPPSVPEAGSQL